MSETNTYTIKGMHCASCAIIIEKTLNKAEGVESARVNFGTELVRVVFNKEKTDFQKISKKVEPLGYSLINMSEHASHMNMNQPRRDKLIEIKGMRDKIISVLPLVVLSVAVMIWDAFIKFNVLTDMPKSVGNVLMYLMPLAATYVLFVLGRPYLMGVYRFVRRGQANMETLIGLGTSAAYIYSMVIAIWGQNLKNYIDISSTYFDVAIVVIAFIALGEYLEARSKFRTGDAIEKLLNLSAKTALVIRDGREVEISVDQVIHEDLIVVKPAGKIPVDGIITEGSSYIDEAMISGEPIPVQKEVGDRVIAGTINTTGYFVFRATGVGSETLLFRIIKMVGEAQSSKAPIQALADKISGVFVPIVLILSFAALAAWLIVGTQYLGFAQALSSGLVSFVGILVIACPCALGLATPTAIIVGVGKAAQEGVLIKDAATLQKLHQANVLVVDKTGTITKGKPEFLSLKNYSSKTDLEMISILASLEKKSEHPIAQAIIDHAIKENIAVLVADRFEIIKGRGLKGVIDGIEYFAGSVKYMNDLGLSVGDEVIKGETTEGKTPVILATGDKILSVAMVADAIKAEAVGSIANLHKLGFEIVMATGDDKNTAEYIAKRVGIDKVFAEVMPEDKLQIIKKLQSEGRIVVMAGDGVNDAPALAQADIGIAMATGTDVAIESAGITLLHGDISKIVKAINLSKATMRGIKQNLFWAFFYNIIGIPLAGGAFYPLFGWLLSPVFAGMAMAFSSVSVVTNSLRLKNKKI